MKAFGFPLNRLCELTMQVDFFFCSFKMKSMQYKPDKSLSGQFVSLMLAYIIRSTKARRRNFSTKTIKYLYQNKDDFQNS